MRYRAFLSYAHADTRWATWLHRAIERTSIAKDMRGRITALGPVPDTLRPIFRDREDFAGGAGLQGATLSAIDESAALIVICSPTSAGRPIVNHEVQQFRARHPDRPVIPVVVDGDYPENFPPALRCELNADGSLSDRPITLLGADLRDTGDGRSLGLAKVVAGLLGVPTDEVVRRAQSQQRLRMRNWIIGLSLVAAALGGLATVAEINRREATAAKRRIEAVFDLAAALRRQSLLDPQSNALMQAVQSAAALPLRGSVVLWVDDNPRANPEERSALDRFGIEVVTAVSTAEALSKLAARRFDLVITDFERPAEGSNAAYRLLDAMKGRADSPPLIIYSLVFTPEQAEEARRRGAVDQVRGALDLFVRVVDQLDRTRTAR